MCSRTQEDWKGAAGYKRTGEVQYGTRGKERCIRVQEDRDGEALCRGQGR